MSLFFFLRVTNDPGSQSPPPTIRFPPSLQDLELTSPSIYCHTQKDLSVLICVFLTLKMTYIEIGVN